MCDDDRTHESPSEPPQAGRPADSTWDLAPFGGVDVDDEITRLLAHATGEHLPIELALRVRQLERQRAFGYAANL